MNFKTKNIAIFTICLFVISITLAQNNTYTSFSTYSIKNGLSSFNPTCIIQDRFGFIWIGTQDGLNRFDGKEFNVYSRGMAKPHRLLQNHVKDLLLIQDTLWVTTSLGGIDFINTRNGNVIYSISPLNNSNFSPWVESFLYHNNSVWMAGYTGLQRIDLKTKKIKFWDKNPFNNRDEFIAKKIAFDSKHQLWVAVDNYGLILMNPLTEKIEKLFLLPPTINKSAISFNDIMILSDTLVCCTSNGLFLFNINQARLSEIDSGVDKRLKRVTSFNLVKSYLNNWYLSTSDGIFILDQSFSVIKEINDKNSSLSDTQVTKCYFDGAQNLWALTYRAVQTLDLNTVAFKHFFEDSTSKNKLLKISTILRWSDEILLIASWSGLYSLNVKTSHIDKLSFQGHKLEEPFYNFFKHSDGNVFVSGFSKVYKIVNKAGSLKLNLLHGNPGKYPIPGNFIFSSVLMLGKDSFLLGSEHGEGLVLSSKTVSARNFTVNYKPFKISGLKVNKLFKDSKGFLWVLYENSIDLIDLKQNTVKSIYPGMLPIAPDAPVFFDIAECSGKIWIASYGGGIYFKNINDSRWQVLNTENSLCNNSVFTLTSENDSTIWASTNIGLSRINTKNNTVRNFFTSQDNRPIPFDERSALKVKGQLYFGGPDGLIRISPAFLKRNDKPSTTWIKQISYILKNNKNVYTDLLQTQIEIPYDANNIEVVFSSINYVQPELNQFGYKIDNNNWSFIGTSNSIILSGLEPGKHMLSIKSSNNSGLWQVNPNIITVYVIPPWYQTLWFKLLLVATGLAIVYSLYRYRLYQLKREEAIRAGIAADLHDDIGSTLTSVRMFTDLGIAKNTLEYFPVIRQGLQDASASLRDTIWVLDKSNNNVKELLERVSRFAFTFMKAAHFEFNIIHDDDLEGIKLTTELRRDLYLIFKEFITNSVKYAHCNKITLTVKKQRKIPSITIQDNGIGFDVATVTRGNGLNNMVKRASQAGYKAIFTSAQNSGTLLELLPL
jgi:ligand-binding sensor domain-containing protein/two-component sensor histidine kinase